MNNAVAYRPSIRWRLIRFGIPVLLFLIAVSVYVLSNAETFEANSEPDAIGIPAFLVLMWVSVSGLVFIPILLIGNTQVILADEGLGFGGKIKAGFLNVSAMWHQVVRAGYMTTEFRSDGIYTQNATFGLWIAQGKDETFISLQHFRDQLGEGKAMGDHLRRVAPHVYRAIQQALQTKTSVNISVMPTSSNRALSPSELAQQGEQAMRAGNYEQAVDLLRQAIRQQPDLFDAYFYLTNSLDLLGYHEDALNIMKKAFVIHPTSSSIAYNIGIIAKRLGRDGEARQYWRQALKLAHDDARLADKQAFINTVQALL